MSDTQREDLRICVTGLSGAGKTAFITALIDALQHAHLAPGNFQAWEVVRRGDYLGAEYFPPGGAVAGANGFPLVENRKALLGDEPSFPPPTKGIHAGLLVAKKREQPGILQRGMDFVRRATPETSITRIGIAVVDYPGEWALDLPLRKMSFVEWSRQTLAAARHGLRGRVSGPFLDSLAATSADAPYHWDSAQVAHRAFVEYLEACHQDLRLSYIQPGHFLRPEKLGGRKQLLQTEAVCFFPIDIPEGQETPKPGSFHAKLTERFEAYKRNQVAEFFQSLKGPGDTRQVVLFDLLSAVAAGAECYEDARRALREIAAAMQPQTGFLGWLFGSAVKVLYAATKADYLHASARAAMRSHIEAMVPELRAEDGRPQTHVSCALAALHVTRDVLDAQKRPAVAGTVWIPDEEDPSKGQLVPNRSLRFPAPPPHLPTLIDWLEWEDAGVIGHRLPDFRPERSRMQGRKDLPHSGLDSAIQFLVGDYV